MRSSGPLAGVLALVCSMAAWGAGQSEVGSRRGVSAAPSREGISTRIEHVDSSLFPRVEATVQVFTEERQVLASDDFVVSEDGKKVDGFQVVVDPRPIYLVLVLDQSGSMKPSLAHLKKAAFEFVDILDERVRTQLVTFSDEVHSRTGFIQDDRLVKRRVADLQADGGTRLFDAIDLAARNVGPYPEEVRRVVVVFTDGQDGKAGLKGQLSRTPAKAVAGYARSHGVPLYFLGLGQGVQQGLLTKLAAATGGEALFSTRTEDLRGIFQRMAHSLGTSYRLVYQTPNPKADGSLRRIHVLSRLKGKKDQGEGVYRAPKPAKDGSPPAQMARRKGLAAYQKVLGSLINLGNYGVRVNSCVTPPKLGGLGGVDLTTRLDLTHVLGVGTDMDMNMDLGSQNLDVRVVRQSEDAYVKVGSLQGADLETRVKLSGRTDLGWLENPVENVIGWLGMAGKKGTKVSAPSDGSSFLFQSPDKIVQLDPEGKSRGVLTFDRKSFLPTHLISFDAKTGASSNVRFQDWKVGGKFTILLPDAEKISAEAEKFALKTAESALKTAGSALRTAEAAVDASAKSLQMIQPWTEQGVGVAVKSLGGVSRMLSSDEFRQAVTAGPRQAAYWTRFAGDFEGKFEKQFQASMQQFDQDLGSSMEKLDRDLEASSKQFEINMANFGNDLAAAGTQMGAEIAGQATGVALDAADAALDAGLKGGQAGLDAAGETVDDALDAADQAMDAAGGALSGVRGLVGEDGQEGLDEAEEALEEAGDALDAARNIEAIGRGSGLSGLQNLGTRLQGLGSSMNQGQGSDGDW